MPTFASEQYRSLWILSFNISVQLRHSHGSFDQEDRWNRELQSEGLWRCFIDGYPIPDCASDPSTRLQYKRCRAIFRDLNVATV